MLRRAGPVLLLVLVAARSAHADKVGTLAAQLRDSSDYKIRLSSALSLAESHDIRAVAAMTWSLGNDPEPTVRSVAALALPGMLDDSVPQGVIDVAVNGLERAAHDDPEPKVRRAALRGFERVAGRRTQITQDRPAVFVNVGSAADATREAPPGTTEKLRGAVQRTLRERAPELAQSWPAGDLPTRAELERAGTRAFFVGAAVSELQVSTIGNRAEVRCAVMIRVGPWTGADGNEKIEANRAASASGSGRVTATSTAAGLANAKSDCVLAVVEQITAREVVPFIRRTAALPE